jgi:hypothetical protein
MSRYTFFTLVTILGIGSAALGATAKIIHLSFANSVLAIGLSLKVVRFSPLAWFLFKTFDKKK